LRLGLGPLERYVLRDGPIVADRDMVVTEHAEEWYWGTGESVVLPFVSVMEVRDGKLVRWWDYWDMQTLMSAAPEWWVEHIMQGYQ
jgi:limonene-1,2-epoxide hydrolase